MAIWLSTLALVIVLAAIIRSEVMSGRRNQARLAQTNERIAALARHAHARHRQVCGRDPTGVFPEPSKLGE